MNHQKLILAVGLGLGLIVLPSCGGLPGTIGEEGAGEADDPDAALHGDAPKISSAQPVFNYGSVKQGEVVEHTFAIANTGTRDLHIERAKGS